MILENQIALVTGASRGIGRAVSLALAGEGASVALVATKAELLEQVAKEIRGLGREALVLQVDVTKEEDVKKAVEAALDKLGRIDILVNNAGVTRDNLLMRMSGDEWDAVLDTNLKGAFHFTKAVTRTMLKQKSGRIINMSSVIGLMGNPGQANYAASKAGLIGFTKACAKELASRQITVNAIAPGFIETAMTEGITAEIRNKLLQMIPQQRFGRPEEVARAVVFLASEDAAYITGEVLSVDGGMVMD